jgi:hypothetical protein
MMAPFGSELGKLRAQELRMHPSSRRERPGRLRRISGRILIGLGTRLSKPVSPDAMVARRSR